VLAQEGAEGVLAVADDQAAVGRQLGRQRREVRHGERAAGPQLRVVAPVGDLRQAHARVEAPDAELDPERLVQEVRDLAQVLQAGAVPHAELDHGDPAERHPERRFRRQHHAVGVVAAVPEVAPHGEVADPPAALRRERHHPGQRPVRPAGLRRGGDPLGRDALRLQKRSASA
jgi:hypothetical protein